jgi:thiamine biosynthesis lipoprotein
MWGRLKPLAKRLFTLIALWLAPLLLNGAEPVRVESAAEAMGATFSLVLYGADRARLETAAQAALDEAQRLDRMLSNYLPDSEWSRVNREAARQPVKVSAELFALLSACLEYTRESEGAFDITVAPLMKAWGFFRDEGRLPKNADIEKAMAHTGYRHVALDPTARTVRFDEPGVELDPGGIGKGYAVDRMVEVLQRRGVEIAMVSVGSSIYGMGGPPETPEGWRVIIRAPDDPHRTAAQVFLKNMSLSTSAGYEKFFRAAGRTWPHIMDPRTGYPARGASAVSVIAHRTIDSEAWAKPYFINGRTWTAAHKPKDVGVFFCDERCSWIP